MAIQTTRHSGQVVTWIDATCPVPIPTKALSALVGRSRAVNEATAARVQRMEFDNFLRRVGHDLEIGASASIRILIYSFEQSNATPLMVQYCGGFSVAKWTLNTWHKLVRLGFV